MKEFFRDHPFLASAVTLLSVWSVTGTVRYVFGKQGPKTSGVGPVSAKAMPAHPGRSNMASAEGHLGRAVSPPIRSPFPPTYSYRGGSSQSSGQSAAHQGDDS